MRHFLLILLISLFAVACGNDAPSNQQDTTATPKPLKEVIPGIWETISVRVVMNSVGGDEDSTSVFEVSEEQWEKTLGIKPIRTYYERDNKFRSVYRAYGNDSIVNVTRGIWNTFGDTLMLIEPEVTYIYDVEIRPNGTGIFRSMLDWDGDEMPDDEYIGIQRLVSKSTID